MADRKKIIILAVLLGIFTATLPVFISLYFSMRYAEQQELQRIDGYADEVLRLTLETGKQLHHVFDSFEGNLEPSCSPNNVSKMLNLHMASSMLQAVAAIKDDQLVCSSFGTRLRQHLGPSQPKTPDGVRSWLNVRLDFASSDTFNIYEKNGFAGIVPRDQIVDIYSQQEHLSLGVALLNPGVIVRSRGDFHPVWLNHYLQTNETQFKQSGYWVVIKPYPEFNVAGISAIPVADVEQRLGDIAYIVIPLGGLVGLLLSLLVFKVARQRISVERDMRNALKRGEFFMVYQPIVDLQTGDYKGAEALIRWLDVDGNEISPEVFIPIAEERGLISEITEYILTKISDEIGDLWVKNPNFCLSINLSSQDLQSHKTVLMLSEFIQRNSPNKGALCIEATERGFVDVQQAKAVITALRALGVKVAVDDFGTGYSSLSYIETLDLDALKIDKSFVDTLCTEAATSSVALHIIEMAKSLKLETVAEGVETQCQVDFLRERGVPYAQGWYFAKPMSMDDLRACLTKQSIKLVKASA